MQFWRKLLRTSSAGNKRKAKAVNGDFQQELLSPENDYRIGNNDLFNLDIGVEDSPHVAGNNFAPEYNSYFPNNPLTQITNPHLSISEEYKKTVESNHKDLADKTLGTIHKKQMTLNDAKKQPAFIELQKALIMIESLEALHDISLIKDVNHDSNCFLPNVFRLATFHEDVYLSLSITPNPLSTNSIEEIKCKVEKFGCEISIGYKHTGAHWISLIIDRKGVVQEVDPFTPKYNSPDGSVITGVKQSDGVSCSLFSMINNVLFLNRVNATDVCLTTSDVKAIKSAISYKGGLCYNFRAKIMLQHFADRILVQGLIQKVEKSSLPNRQSILKTLNKNYNSLLRGCKFDSSIELVEQCFNAEIVNTRLLNKEELLDMFKVNLELQNDKQIEDVSKPSLNLSQEYNNDAVKLRVPYVSQTASQSKQKNDNLTIVKDAIKIFESKLQIKSGISADKTAAEFITALKNNLNSQKNNQESKTPEAIILDSLAKTDYGNLLSQSNSCFNNKSTFTKDDLIVFTGSNDDFEKFIKDVMPVYEEIENAKRTNSAELKR